MIKCYHVSFWIPPLLYQVREGIKGIKGIRKLPKLQTSQTCSACFGATSTFHRSFFQWSFPAMWGPKESGYAFSQTSAVEERVSVLWTVLLYPSVSELKRCKVAGQFPQSGKVAKYACNLLALSSITSHVGRTWPKWVGIQYTLWANWCKLCKSFGFLCLAPIGGTLREVHLCYNQ